MSMSFENVKVATDLIVKSGNVPNIIGLQGIGKSELVRGYALDSNYGFAEITCSLLQEGDLAMPYISKKDDGSQEVHYAINSVIKNLVEDADNHELSVLFLDEFNRSSSQVQSELMNLVLQREIVGYHLPDSVRVILAMNPSSEMEGFEGSNYSVSFSDAAMMGRVVSIKMKPEIEEWLAYGSKVVDGKPNVHRSILNFLKQNRELFYTKEEEGKINNTPRGWKRASDILYSYESMGIKSFGLLKEVLKGTLENTTVDMFISHYKTNANVVDYDKVASEILDGICPPEYDTLSEVGLTTVFEIMCKLCSNAKEFTPCMRQNFVIYFKAVSNALKYSWHNMLVTKYNDLYQKLTDEDADKDVGFLDCMLEVLENAQYSSGEEGSFDGKH